MNSASRCALVGMGSLLLSACAGGEANVTSSKAQNPLDRSPITGNGLFPSIPLLTPTNGPLPSVLSLPQISSAPPVNSLTSSVNTNPVKVDVKYDYASTPIGAQKSARRNLQYISANNTIMTVVVTPVGGSAATPVSTGCTQASCIASFTANPGPNLLSFTLTDGTNTLSTFSTMQIIQPNIINTLNLTPNPVVNSVTLTLAASTVNAGTATGDVVTVNARDADGNIIVGMGNFTDANGSPLKLILSISNTQNGGSGGIALHGPMTITSPNHAAISALYNGAWLDHSTISVTSSLAIAGTLGTATLTTVPTATVYIDGLSDVCGITSGPDGAIWFAECGANQIGRITTDGVFSSFYTVGTYPNNVAVGPDGNVWAPNADSDSISRITPGGTVTTFTAGFTSPGIPNWIVMGSDGNMWFVDQYSRIGRITPTGVVSYYPTTAFASPIGIALGPDGNIWFTEYALSRIGRITTNAKITEFSTGMTAGANPQGITAGPDGNVWFTERIGNRIGRITPAGVITEFSTNLTANADPVWIVSGPDGNLWFGEDTGGKIGRITTSGTITEYGNGLTSGAKPQFVTFGPDGNLWIGGYSGLIARFVY